MIMNNTGYYKKYYNSNILKSSELSLWISESVWGQLTSAWGSPDYTRRRGQNRQN
ncbi:hypothetical protein IEQ34_021511 [Dendrobium chrysotoxum]|uniref:Uncharacterized protein n=1 Tax=Dendrobium chrysotoxum TaxID=161865 RepID=A0AAV7G4C9_DENCH|nr:hypothetical protein IEQ34_021511 [Dendrobium chrysotoxum]